MDHDQFKLAAAWGTMISEAMAAEQVEPVWLVDVLMALCERIEDLEDATRDELVGLAVDAWANGKGGPKA